MIENRDIQQGAITLTKLSKNLRLPLANIAAGTAGQVPVVQSNGDLAYKAIGGDATLDADGNLAVTLAATTTDTIPEGSNNLYYTDARVDARIRQIKHEADQQATNEEPGFMPKEDKAKLDATSDASSAVRKFSTTITGDGSTDIFTIQHNLGTQHLMVSVRTPVKSGGATLADKFDNQSFIQMDVGYDASTPGVSVGHFDAAGNLSDNHVTLEFAGSAPGDGDVYLITIIG